MGLHPSEIISGYNKAIIKVCLVCDLPGSLFVALFWLKECMNAGC